MTENRQHGLVKPFLRWAGSKRQLLPKLSSYWTAKHGRYFEPFLGSGCLFFAIQPSKAVLSDINNELIATYEQIRKHPLEVFEALNIFQNNENEYYRMRGIDSITLAPIERASRFIYLNRYSFNGLYRTNKLGRFNVPYGGDKTGNLPNKDIILACSKALSNVTLVAGDFEHILDETREKDFVYLDPPYKVSNRRVFNEYDSSSFSTNDLLRLKQLLDKLTYKGTEFLVSYADCDEAYTLSKGYSYKIVTVRRNIAGFTKKRKTTTELLISNNLILNIAEAS